MTSISTQTMERGEPEPDAQLDPKLREVTDIPADPLPKKKDSKSRNQLRLLLRGSILRRTAKAGEEENNSELNCKNIAATRSDILKKRSQRLQKRTDMAKRRSAAAQERMRILSQLARKEKHDKIDTFRMRDEDWDVYKTIQKDGGESDSDDEQDELNELKQLLKTHDPSFATEMETEAKGPEDDNELHVGLEVIRAPELMFQPSMIGEFQAGIPDTIEHILKLHPGNVQERLTSNIFLTGGPASFKGLFARMETHLLEIRPFQSTFSVNLASDPVLNAWGGMQELGSDPYNLRYLVTRADFYERGEENFKEYSASNKYFPSPHMTSTSTLTMERGDPEPEPLLDPNLMEVTEIVNVQTSNFDKYI